MSAHPSFGQTFRVWVRVAMLSFGGPAGQIAVMHRILVEEKRWISESRFLHALNYCMLLPGPEAQQLATYIGWLLHGPRGGLTSGLLFVLPGFLAILALSLIYSLLDGVPLVEGIFFGIKAAVLAIVVEAVQRIGKRALKNRVMLGLAAGAFLGIFLFHIPFPLIVLISGLVGLIGGWKSPDLFRVLKSHQAKGEHETEHQAYYERKPTLVGSIKVCILWLGIWWTPVLALALALGDSHVLTQQALFFSKAALVTFGGAYSVLAYIAQQAVEVYGWLKPQEMLDGLGMAETTPGPLIQVVQFVGYMGAFRNPAPFSPVTAAVLGSIITTWVTFAPCFLWIFVGAPFVEGLRQNRYISSALSCITAAVVGVILHLAIWFSLHVLFEKVDDLQWGVIHWILPHLSTLHLPTLLISAFSFYAIFRRHWGIIPVLGASAGMGVIYSLISPAVP